MTIDVAGPDGSSFSFPDGTGHDVISGAMTAHYGGPEAKPALSAGETAADMGKSGAVGIAKGLIGLAGMPGDLTSLVGRGADWAAEKLTGERPQVAGSILPTSGDMLSKLKFYEPQSTAGKYAQTVGEFAPAAAMGPGGLARKAVTQVAIPAIASEAAGQATEGTAAEPWARAAAGVGAGLAGGAASALRGAPQAVAPTLDAIQAARNADYAAVRNLGVTVRPAAVQRGTDAIAADLAQQGLTDTVAPRTLAVLERLGNQAAPATITDIDNARKVLGQIARGASSPSSLERIEAGAARQAVEGIDNFLPALTPGDLAAGAQHHAQTIEHLTNARGNAAAAFKAQALDRAEYNAANNAAAANSGANGENALRQQLKSILNSPGRASQFNAAERAQMQTIVRGEGVRNAVRTAGNLLGGGGGLGALVAAGAGHVALPGLGVAAPLVGYGLKRAGNAITTNRLNDLTANVRANSPLGQAMPQPALQPRLTAPQLAMLSAMLALQGSAGGLPVPQAEPPVMQPR